MLYPLSYLNTYNTLVLYNISVEMADAGDGTIEIKISGPTGQLIPHDVINASPGLLVVQYMSTMSGPHKASVTYNGSSVPGP